MRRSARGRRLLAASVLGLGFGAVATIAVLSLLAERPERLYEIVDPPDADVAYFQHDPDLGYAPARSVRAHVRRTNDGRDLYDVTYTIGPDGFRPTPGDSAAPAFVFFGCSFTFGEGVEDDETLPAQFAEALDRPANVLNLGFHGYGPHQMLRLLETDRVAPLVPGGVVHVYYSATSGHARRAAGRVTWDVEGPRYEIDEIDEGDVGEEGDVVYQGPFHAAPVALAMKVLTRFDATNALVDAWLALGEDVARDEERWIAIVARAAKLVREKWKAGFTVVYWGDEEDTLPDRLQARGIEVVRVWDLLGRSNRRRFLIRHDGHPNALANRRIARSLAAEVDEPRPSR
ncbi:MAG: hypothetical protein FJ144_18630 [Deltaproteobacteria bacterium]|nr:hypothetical protein [Deltaproteobacteria bacterium]